MERPVNEPAFFNFTDMAEYVVELPELEVACDFFLESEYPYFEELREAFLVMKYCGCRPMELFEINRWIHVSGWEFQMQPQKNNLVRSITLGVGCELFRTCVINQIKPFLGRTYSQLQGLFYKLCPWRPIFSGNREITLYVYRYFFVKSLIADGLTYAQVAELMGHRTETPVYLYANAILTSTYEIPVTPVDPVPLGHIDILTFPLYFDGTSIEKLYVNSIDLQKFSFCIKCLPENIGYSRLMGTNHAEIVAYYPYFQTNYAFGNWYYSIGLGRGTATTSCVFSLNFVGAQFRTFYYEFDQTEINLNDPSKRNYKFKVYVDGILKNSSYLLKQGVLSNTNPYGMLSGYASNDGNRLSRWKGTVNFSYFWNRLLTTDEILSLNSL